MICVYAPPVPVEAQVPIVPEEPEPEPDAPIQEDLTPISEVEEVETVEDSLHSMKLKP